MEITKEMFKSFKGLEYLKKMAKTKSCDGIDCKTCPFETTNLNNKWWECTDIVFLDEYTKKEEKRMNKVIDIFTKENINSVLSEIAPNRNLKYNDYVVYDNKPFKIKGVVKKNSTNLILLNGCDVEWVPIYESCIVPRKAMKKAYTLLVEPSEVFALNDIVIEEESNIEYKIVAIDATGYPILLNDDIDNFLKINECGDILSSIPEAHEQNYSKWVVSDNIKHK